MGAFLLCPEDSSLVTGDGQAGLFSLVSPSCVLLWLFIQKVCEVGIALLPPLTSCPKGTSQEVPKPKYVQGCPLHRSMPAAGSVQIAVGTAGILEEALS